MRQTSRDCTRRTRAKGSIETGHARQQLPDFRQPRPCRRAEKVSTPCPRKSCP